VEDPPPAREPSPAPVPRAESPEPAKPIDHDKIEETKPNDEGELIAEHIKTDLTQSNDIEETGEKKSFIQNLHA